MFVLKNEGRRKKEKKLGKWCVEVRHDRATTGTGRANLLDSCGLEGLVWHGRATAGTGRAKVLAVLTQNFFFSVFLNRARTITYKTT